jgi:hypothetical protein
VRGRGAKGVGEQSVQGGCRGRRDERRTGRAQVRGLENVGNEIFSEPVLGFPGFGVIGNPKNPEKPGKPLRSFR